MEMRSPHAENVVAGLVRGLIWGPFLTPAVLIFLHQINLTCPLLDIASPYGSFFSLLLYHPALFVLAFPSILIAILLGGALVGGVTGAIWGFGYSLYWTRQSEIARQHYEELRKERLRVTRQKSSDAPAPEPCPLPPIPLSDDNG